MNGSEYTDIQWGIDLGNTGHVEQYDDEEDAREHLKFYKSGTIMSRLVTYGPWRPHES